MSTTSNRVSSDPGRVADQVDMTPLQRILATREPGSDLARVADFRHRVALLRRMDCLGVPFEAVHSMWLEDVTDPRLPESFASIRVHYSASGSGFCRHFHPKDLNAWLDETPTREEVERLLPLDRSTHLLNLCARVDPSEEEREVVRGFASEKSLCYVTDPYETVARNVLEYLRSGLACLTQVESNGRTVWVNAGDGCCVGRFSQAGVDVHHGARVQVETGRECVDCTHERPTAADWQRFVASMRKLGADVSPHRPAWLDETAPTAVAPAG